MITTNQALARIQEFRLHPLGFFYLRSNAVNGTSSRFHIWPSREFGVPDNECHQHTFDIRSSILAGRMKSELFTFNPSAGGREREFAVEYDIAKSSLRPTGRSGVLERICEFDSHAGASYFLQAGVIHRVSIMQRPCVTALATVDRGIEIFSYGQDVAEAPFDRRLVDSSEIDEIGNILRALTTSSRR
ncbi:hypothetical protein [Rhizobium leguminosarum]|uniref:hypothetical protein n=1 Tax=Rhizobium leguminosarum TaxID=384 RepID=UPI001C95AADC|nr:hypothetical protein [Rhizobium leguminosarum]MBY5751419.1 hypothetical protein [Rhizobium leguminosarum]